jgi:serine/threonine-protein kinase
MVPDEVKPRAEPRIPGYRLEGIVGRGATGVVYRARQLSVERVVALKVLHPELVGAKSAALRLQREARTTARLAHPNIISAIDMGEVDGVWWYAMELVEGVSLLERLREKPLSEREALRMFIPLCDALQHAFQRGVVHRDIKPANILVDKSGRALLVDLGLAVADDDPFLTKGGGTLGTPHYISPEQARDPSSADTQSDIWSLGATMYHALCGRPPFSGDSVAEILSAVLYARVPDPAERAPQLSNGLVLVLRKCLTRDRAHRYATPAALMADLERVRERRQPEVKRSALDPLERRARPLGRAAITAALIVLAVVAIWFIARSSGDARLAAQTAAPGSNPDPIERLSQAAAGDVGGLSRAFADVSALQASARLTPAETVRVEELRRKIRQRLESELASFEHDAEARIAAALREHRFDAAQKLAGGLRKELSQRIGSEPLPERKEAEIESWINGELEAVRSARVNGEAELASALEHLGRERVLPEVDRLQAEGRWRDAQLLLAADFSADPALGADLGALRAALPADAVDRAESSARKTLETRRAALEQAWKTLDDELRAWAAARVDDWKQRLEGRVAFDAAQAFASEWQAELARRALSVEEMPLGWLNLAREEVVKGERELGALEKKLADDDALRSFERVEDSAAELWRQRRYGEAAQLYESSAADAWRQAVRAKMELRAREARILEAYLAQAAAGLRASDGRNLELRSGTILVSGVLSAGADPLANGFRLTLSGGKTRALSLRATSGSDASAMAPLAAESIEALADQAQAALAQTNPPADAASASSPSAGTDDHKDRAARTQLARALLRFREGDVSGAQTALGSGDLPIGEPLVFDLESRIAAAVAQQKSSENEDRGRWLEKLYLLRREFYAKGNREQTRRSAEELLSAGAGALTPEELADVRRIRDELSGDVKSSTEQALATAFNPNELALTGANKSRVRMTFKFDRDTAGAFDRGAWTADGRAWSAAYAAKSDEDMLARAAPTLLLGDLLRVQNDDIDVRLKFEEPADSRSDLLLVSIAGFQVVLVGASNGRPARCHVDTLNADQVVQSARGGAGREFAGVKSGATHELYLKVNRARGTALVELDEKRIPAEFKPRPRSDPATASLSIRSFEPIHLLQATIECARR